MAALVQCSCWRNLGVLSRISFQTAFCRTRNFQSLSQTTSRALPRIAEHSSTSNPWIKTLSHSPQNISVRNYCDKQQQKGGGKREGGSNQGRTQRKWTPPPNVTGDHDQLWKSVLSGRGTGRRKKKKQQGVDSRLLGFGKSKIKFPVLYKPLTAEERQQQMSAEPPKVDDAAGKYKRAAVRIPQGWSLRGYSGTNWGGRRCGHPMTPTGDILTNFDSIVLELRRVSVMKATGRRKGLRAIVAVGNYNGLVGLGVGSGNRMLSTIEKARNKAANYLYYIDRCDGHTIYHSFEAKYKACKMVLERKPAGHGLRCQRIMKTIATLAGLKDLKCRMLGSTTPMTVAKGTIQAFLQQESHGELAERSGLNVVEFRKENSYRPVVVARPSEKSAEATMKKISEDDDGFYDYETIMDEYRGLHKPKSKFDIF